VPASRGLRVLVFQRRLCHAEIEQLDEDLLPVFGVAEKDVGRLKIAMNDPSVVSHLQGPAKLGDDLDDELDGQLFFAAHARGELFALQKLEHDEGGPGPDHPEVAHPANVPRCLPQTSGQLGLSFEAAAPFRIGFHRGVQEFDGHRVPEHHVRGLPHGSQSSRYPVAR